MTDDIRVGDRFRWTGRHAGYWHKGAVARAVEETSAGGLWRAFNEDAGELAPAEWNLGFAGCWTRLPREEPAPYVCPWGKSGCEGTLEGRRACCMDCQRYNAQTAQSPALRPGDVITDPKLLKPGMRVLWTDAAGGTGDNLLTKRSFGNEAWSHDGGGYISDDFAGWRDGTITYLGGPDEKPAVFIQGHEREKLAPEMEEWERKLLETCGHKIRAASLPSNPEPSPEERWAEHLRQEQLIADKMRTTGKRGRDFLTWSTELAEAKEMRRESRWSPAPNGLGGGSVGIWRRR